MSKTSVDGPASGFFTPVQLQSNLRLESIIPGMVSQGMAQYAARSAPSGDCVAWGIPFFVGDVILVKNAPVTVHFPPVQASWLVIMHTADERPLEQNAHGFISPMRGEGSLNEHAADYVFLYEDGTQEKVAVRMRHQLCTYSRRWGENGFQCVAAHKPIPVLGAQEQVQETGGGRRRASTPAILTRGPTGCGPGRTRRSRNELWAYALSRSAEGSLSQPSARELSPNSRCAGGRAKKRCCASGRTRILCLDWIPAAAWRRSRSTWGR